MQILVGMRDDHDELVAATLSALATLVPLLGASVVMGTSRKRVFTDVQPRKARITSHFLVYTSILWYCYFVIKSLCFCCVEQIVLILIGR